ncbi:MAG: SEC-C domain-containing protein [Clostridiales bacterium]|nr:SEC-C domain-containing protein [Clostridiales bacterium]
MRGFAPLFFLRQNVRAKIDKKIFLLYTGQDSGAANHRLCAGIEEEWIDMTLYEKWVGMAYDKKNGASVQKCWDEFSPKEQKIYETLLEKKISHLETTVQEFGKRFDIQPEFVCGFLDGINEALRERMDLSSLDLDSPITIDFDFARLYQKMVEYRVEALYSLPQWKQIFSEAERETLFRDQRRSTTVVRQQAKIGRNDPCPCGSGKKYKKCCGAMASQMQSIA